MKNNACYLYSHGAFPAQPVPAFIIVFWFSDVICCVVPAGIGGVCLRSSFPNFGSTDEHVLMYDVCRSRRFT